MLYDISQTLSRDLPVWPGDTRFRMERTWSMDDGTPVNVSALTLSTHSGSHADAPLHYVAGGAAIDAVSPETYLGPAQVVDGRGAAGHVTVSDIGAQLLPGVTRVLVRTYDHAPLAVWDSTFTAIDPALIDYIAALGVRLIGVDTPSLDPETSKDMAAHRAVARHGLAILEGLVLDAVPFGLYELIALPLRISGADSSPVRAVLRSMPA